MGGIWEVEGIQQGIEVIELTIQSNHDFFFLFFGGGIDLCHLETRSNSERSSVPTWRLPVHCMSYFQFSCF